MKDNPELQNKEVDKLKNDLEREKKQTTFLQSQLATLRTQMSTDLALIKNKEAQIKGNFFLNRLGPIRYRLYLLVVTFFINLALKASTPKKIPKANKKANKKLKSTIQSLEAEVIKLQASQSIGGGPDSAGLKNKNRILTGEVSGLKTQVNNLQNQVVTMNKGLKCLLGTKILPA